MTGRTLFTVFALSIAALATAQTDNAREVAKRVEAVTLKQRERPFWFVLDTNVLKKIPFAYQVSVSRTKFLPDGSGQTTASTSWCSAYGDGSGQCLGELAQLKAAPRPPRNQKVTEAQRFWDEFRKAFTFEMRERPSRQGRPTTVVSFVPKSGYVPSRNDDTAIFPYIRGQIWIDDTDMEIARFEYEFFKDSSAMVFGQIREGTRYSMDLEKQLDGVWLPRQAATELRLAVMRSSFHEASTVQFSNYFE